VVDGAGPGEAGAAGVLERSVQKKHKRKVPRHFRWVCRGLERENVFVYCDATPPCSGVSNMRHPSPEVRESCMKFMKQTDAFVQKMHAEGLFDAALFENIKECIDLW